MGPLLFLVLMVPFTVNGLGVREAFFVAFLARFGVDSDAAFATGFLFYAVTMATALPGAVLLLTGGFRRGAADQEPAGAATGRPADEEVAVPSSADPRAVRAGEESSAVGGRRA
jgi:hypothetical protein